MQQLLERHNRDCVSPTGGTEHKPILYPSGFQCTISSPAARRSILAFTSETTTSPLTSKPHAKNLDPLHDWEDEDGQYSGANTEGVGYFFVELQTFVDGTPKIPPAVTYLGSACMSIFELENASENIRARRLGLASKPVIRGGNMRLSVVPVGARTGMGLMLDKR